MKNLALTTPEWRPLTHHVYGHGDLSAIQWNMPLKPPLTDADLIHGVAALQRHLDIHDLSGFQEDLLAAPKEVVLAFKAPLSAKMPRDRSPEELEVIPLCGQRLMNEPCKVWEIRARHGDITRIEALLAAECEAYDVKEGLWAALRAGQEVVARRLLDVVGDQIHDWTRYVRAAFTYETPAAPCSAELCWQVMDRGFSNPHNCGLDNLLDLANQATQGGRPDLLEGLRQRVDAVEPMAAPTIFLQSLEWACVTSNSGLAKWALDVARVDPQKAWVSLKIKGLGPSCADNLACWVTPQQRKAWLTQVERDEGGVQVNFPRAQTMLIAQERSERDLPLSDAETKTGSRARPRP